MDNIKAFTKNCKGVVQLQKEMVLFLMNNAGHWISFASDRDTVEVVCSLVNLGIAEVQGSQIILKSREKADRFLVSFG